MINEHDTHLTNNPEASLINPMVNQAQADGAIDGVIWSDDDTTNGHDGACLVLV